MKRLAFLLAFLMILTALPLGASALEYRPTVTASTGSTVPVGTEVVLTVNEHRHKESAGITPANSFYYQWFIGNPDDYWSKRSIASDSVQRIPGANMKTYVPDTSVPGVTSYFCVVDFDHASDAFVLTVEVPARLTGYVPDEDAPGFENPAETPAPTPAPDADANPNTGVFSFGKPHFGSERVK